ncbi:hypothetical protein V5F23_20305 [Pseudomonas sp. WP18]|uniref:hypothetical protein n=1 Tax=Pseudomonas sp. WP18 TaxID=3118752 RepID=UPI0030CDCE4E
MNDLFATDLDAKIARFHKAFDGPASLLTAVLRGHMMVEERLFDVISGVAIYSRTFKENDLFTFGIAAKLAQAIIGSAEMLTYGKRLHR